MEQKNSFLISLLSVLLLVSSVIAGFFAYQSQKLVKEINSLKGLPTPTATIMPSPILSETPIATNSASPKSSSVACTMEAKICPDGSAVGRSGPNCEFSPCPTTSPQL